MKLNILCYNIHGGYDLGGKRDLSRLHALMDVHNVDIGIFQEIETRPSRGGTQQDIAILSGPDRPYNLPALALVEGEGDTQGWYGNLIVSRYPIIRGLVHDLETHKSFEPRNAVDALIDTPAGVLRIIGTHLSLSPFERWSEVRNLVRLVNAVEETEQRPMLLMGDINEWRGTSRLLRHLNELFNAIPCDKTFPSFWPVFRLDRLWTHNMYLPLRARVLHDDVTRRLSDHLPLLIEIGDNPRAR